MFPLYDENRSRTFPFVTLSLIVVNALVFWWEFTEGFDDRIFLEYGAVPALVLQGMRPLTLITSMFIHVDILHIFGNMLYLFIFGDNVEDRFGHARFFLLYFIFGIAGGLAHSAIVVSAGGFEQSIPTVGASGAVSGILGAYLIFYPSARIVSIVPSFFFFRLARVPAFLFIGFWFLLQILYSGGSESVAYMAHVGGFTTGLTIALAYRALNRKERTRWR